MLRSKLGAGVVAGIIAGVIFGMMMQMMSAPTPAGGSMPMMAMVAMGSLVGHLIFGLILGGVFVKLHHAAPRAITGAGAHAA